MQNQLARGFSVFASQVFGAALKAVAASLVFTTGIVFVLRSMGVPMPSASELLKHVEGLSILAKIIS